MPNVSVKFYMNLRTKAGTDEFPCQAGTVRHALDCVRNKYGDDFMKHVRRCQVFVNSENVVHLKGQDTKLRQGDTLHIFPPAGGG